MTVFLLEMFQRTGLKGYDCSGWRLRKVTRTQKKSYSEPVSTISRELDRNKGKKGYRHKKAQGMAQHRIAVKAAKRRGGTRPPGQGWPSAHIRRNLRLKPALLA